MTDHEFVEFLKRNVTIDAEFEYNRGKPYVRIRLVTIPDKHQEPEILGYVRIDGSDFKGEGS